MSRKLPHPFVVSRIGTAEGRPTSEPIAAATAPAACCHPELWSRRGGVAARVGQVAQLMRTVVSATARAPTRATAISTDVGGRHAPGARSRPHAGRRVLFRRHDGSDWLRQSGDQCRADLIDQTAASARVTSTKSWRPASSQCSGPERGSRGRGGG